MCAHEWGWTHPRTVATDSDFNDCLKNNLRPIRAHHGHDQCQDHRGNFPPLGRDISIRVGMRSQVGSHRVRVTPWTPLKFSHHQKSVPYRSSTPLVHGGVLPTVGTGCVGGVGGVVGRWTPTRFEEDEGLAPVNRLMPLSHLMMLLRYSDAGADPMGMMPWMLGQGFQRGLHK